MLFNSVSWLFIVLHSFVIGPESNVIVLWLQWRKVTLALNVTLTLDKGNSFTSGIKNNSHICMIARNINCKRALCILSVSPTNFRVHFPCVWKIPTSKWEPVYSALALWEPIETVWYHKMWSVFWSSCLTLSHCHTHIWNCPTLMTSVPLLALASHYIGVLPLHPIFSRSTL